MTRARELLRLALSAMRRTPLRVSLTAAGVAVATGALLAMVGFALGMQAQAEESFGKLGVLQRIVVRAEAGAPPLDDAAIGRLAALPGVVAAYPHFRLSEAELRRGGRTHAAFVAGLPPEDAALAFLAPMLAAGRLFRGEAPEALLGAGAVSALGFASPAAAVGEEVVVVAAGLVPAEGGGFRMERRELPVTVAGVYEPPAYTMGLGADGILLPIALARDLPGARFDTARLRKGGPLEGHGQAVVRVRGPRDLLPAKERIEAMGFVASTLVEEVEEMRRYFVLLDAVLAAVGATALLIAGLGIVNTLLVAVLERTREIGLLKALGATDGDVRSLFLSEALLVGFLGGLAGLLLGRVVALGIFVLVNRYARGQGVEYDVAVFAFPLWLHLGALAFATGASALAGLFPAARAARTDPVEALRAG